MTPPIALTCGDPSGIGPELSVKAWQSLGTNCPFFWIGDPKHLPENSPYVAIQHPSETAAVINRGLPVLVQPFPAAARHGQPNLRNAQGVVDAITTAVGLVQSGAASAICTNPINKQALQDGAGFDYPGHTEFLAALAGVDRVVMMLACDTLRVVPTTIHIPLEDVATTLTQELLAQTLRITEAELRAKFAISQPRLAVAGLNPHAGEGGKMGHQERTLIAPVLDRLRAEGLRIEGPLSADTMFHAAARDRYDAAICMYHDQALIPIKTLDFDNGVNVTLGLPFIRTSPDHGTAFDIAGRGIAQPSSLIKALEMAARMSQLTGQHAS
jgi:4-hydroxythreonine-4-phosphate dehydrogenase